MGLIRLEAGPSHGKAKLVQLTAEGERNVAWAVTAFDRIEHELADRIGEAEVAALRSSLETDWGPA